MSGVEVIAVSTPAEMDRFIKLPFALYAADPSFVPPLAARARGGALAARRTRTSSMPRRSSGWRARDGRDVGRISAQIDRLVKDPEIGHFGMLVAEDRPEVFAALFAAAEGWLRERGKKRVLGPFNLSINEESGLLVDGFDTPPMLLMGHDARYVGPAHRGPGLCQGQGPDRLHPGHRRRACRTSARRFIAKRMPKDMTVRHLDTKRYREEFDTVTAIFNDAWSRELGLHALHRGRDRAHGQEHEAADRSGVRRHRRGRRPADRLRHRPAEPQRADRRLQGPAPAVQLAQAAAAAEARPEAPRACR